MWYINETIMLQAVYILLLYMLSLLSSVFGFTNLPKRLTNKQVYTLIYIIGDDADNIRFIPRD